MTPDATFYASGPHGPIVQRSLPSAIQVAPVNATLRTAEPTNGRSSGRNAAAAFHGPTR